MSMLVAAIAFAMSLGALWFTSEVAKRADIRGKILVKPHLANFNAALSRAEEQIRDLSHSLEKRKKKSANCEHFVPQMRLYAWHIAIRWR
jgi:hypothetical protein